MRRLLVLLVLTGATAFIAGCPVLLPDITGCGGFAGSCAVSDGME